MVMMGGVIGQDLYNLQNNNNVDDDNDNFLSENYKPNNIPYVYNEVFNDDAILSNLNSAQIMASKENDN